MTTFFLQIPVRPVDLLSPNFNSLIKLLSLTTTEILICIAFISFFSFLLNLEFFYLKLRLIHSFLYVHLLIWSIIHYFIIFIHLKLLLRFLFLFTFFWFHLLILKFIVCFDSMFKPCLLDYLQFLRIIVSQFHFFQNFQILHLMLPQLMSSTLQVSS